MRCREHPVVDASISVPRKIDVGRGVREGGVYLALAGVVLFNLLFTPNFATLDNARLQLVQVAPVLVVALGMALVIGTGGIDLSVGSVMAIAAALIPAYLGYGPWAAIGVAIIGGMAVGLLNGTLIAFLGLQPIVATLGTLVAGRGLALVIAEGRLTELFDPTLRALGTGSIAGVPYRVLIAAGLAALIAVVVKRTLFGRRIVAIGGNREAATLAGLPVVRSILLVYVICAGLAAVAGVMATSRSLASDPSSVGLLIELNAITAVVVGGTALTGGRVRIVGTIAGAILMQLIVATLIRHNLPDSAARMVQAAVIVAAVYVQRDRTS
jgi:ribose/xylose/arabinose/galactoside ABC-type transport system permease subunit